MRTLSGCSQQRARIPNITVKNPSHICISAHLQYIDQGCTAKVNSKLITFQAFDVFRTLKNNEYVENLLIFILLLVNVLFLFPLIPIHYTNIYIPLLEKNTRPSTPFYCYFATLVAYFTTLCTAAVSINFLSL